MSKKGWNDDVLREDTESTHISLEGGARSEDPITKVGRCKEHTYRE